MEDQNDKLAATECSQSQTIQPEATSSLQELLRGRRTSTEEPVESSRPLLQHHLKIISQTIIDLMFTHSFDAELWTPHLADSFRASPCSPNEPSNMPLPEFLAYLRNLYAENPGWTVRSIHSSSYVQDGLGKVIMNVENRELPEGITTKGLLVCSFREGRWGWRCVEFVGVKGGPTLEGVGS